MLAYFQEHNRYMALVGIAVILGIAYLFSSQRRRVNWRMVGTALILQALAGFVVLKTYLGQLFVRTLADGIARLYQAAEIGSGFVFGALINQNSPLGFIFAFKVLPAIIFFGGFLALLFHFGIVQAVVNFLSRCLQPLLGTTGAETLCAVANSFLGQTEAPLLIRHYLARMSRSEIFVVMVSGMATISGSILAIYSQTLHVPAEHLLAASLMAVPGSLLIAKLLIPATEEVVESEIQAEEIQEKGNIFDALATGTLNGLQLALNVAAMLIVFVALMGLANNILAWLTQQINFYTGTNLPSLTLDYIFGLVGAPVAYLLGITGDAATQAGSLLGIKVVINEFVAYDRMMSLGLSPRVMAIMTYALCGFSNFSCIGIQIGGIGALCPSRRTWLTELGLKAVFASTLVNLLNACIAALLI